MAKGYFRVVCHRLSTRQPRRARSKSLVRIRAECHDELKSRDRDNSAAVSQRFTTSSEENSLEEAKWCGLGPRLLRRNW